MSASATDLFTIYAVLAIGANMNFLGKVMDEYLTYGGTGAVEMAFLLCILFWYARDRKTGTMKIFLWYSLGILIAICNPLTVYVMERTENWDVYERLFWLLMAPVLVAVTMTAILPEETESAGKKRKYWLGIFLGMVLIVFAGKSAYNKNEFTVAENSFKIEQEAILAGDIMVRDCMEMTAEEAVRPNSLGITPGLRAVVPKELSGQIREYNADIELLFVRENMGDWFNNVPVGETMSAEQPDMNLVISTATANGCRYLVFAKSQMLNPKPQDYGLTQIAETDKYVVYRFVW